MLLQKSTEARVIFLGRKGEHVCLGLIVEQPDLHLFEVVRRAE